MSKALDININIYIFTNVYASYYPSIGFASNLKYMNANDFLSFLFFLSWSFILFLSFQVLLSVPFLSRLSFLGCSHLVFLSLSYFVYLTFSCLLSFSVVSCLLCNRSRGVQGGEGGTPLLKRIQTAISSLPVVRFSPDLQVMKANSKVTHKCFGSKLHQSTSSRCSVKSKL